MKAPPLIALAILGAGALGYMVPHGQAAPAPKPQPVATAPAAAKPLPAVIRSVTNDGLKLSVISEDADSIGTIVENVSGRDVTIGELECKFMDARGQIIGVSTRPIGDLLAGDARQMYVPIHTASRPGDYACRARRIWTTPG